MSGTGRILIVDDEKDIRFLLQDILQDEGYEVFEAAHSEAAFSIIESEGVPDLVVLDIWLENSDKDGMEILAAIKKRDADVPVLMISGHGNIEMAVKAIKLGAYDFIEKPFNTDRLILMVKRAIEAAKLKKEMAEDDIRIVAESPEMQTAMKLAGKASQSTARVLITGPWGCGRTYLAKWIHQESGRASKILHALNCADLTPEMIERAFEVSKGGVLLLNELERLNAGAQASLLRTVSEKTSARVIATSDPEIMTMKTDGRFLPDLYERLAVVDITYPALEARRADIVPLIHRIVDTALKNWGIAMSYDVPDTIFAFIKNRQWPGQMHEFKCVVLSAALRMVLAKENVLKPEYLLTDNRDVETSVLTSRDQILAPSEAWLDGDLRTAREHFERWYLESIYERFDGNVSQMASFIGMDRTALHRKLKSLRDDEERLAS